MIAELLAALTLLAAGHSAPAPADVVAYPSAQTIPASGRLPQGSSRRVTLNAAIGEREGAWIAVTGAQTIAARVDGFGLGPLKAALYFGHFVAFGARAVPDALLPWDGRPQAAERPT